MTEPDWSRGILAYNEIASRYDAIPQENRINAYLRRRSTAALLRTFRPGTRLLEIGCGTGEEALALAKGGMRIVATDPSESMLDVARRKAAATGLGDRVVFVPLAARELDDLQPAGAAPFDGAYASFSLAYEPDLRPVVVALHGLMGSSARFVASLPNRVHPMEWALALAAARPGLAGRRLRPWHGHKVGEASVPIRTYTPVSFGNAIAPYFRVHQVAGLATVIPPPYMNRAYARIPGLGDTLEKADERIAAWPGVRALGDHFLAVCSRVDRAV